LPHSTALAYLLTIHPTWTNSNVSDQVLRRQPFVAKRNRIRLPVSVSDSDIDLKMTLAKQTIAPTNREDN